MFYSLLTAGFTFVLCLAYVIVMAGISYVGFSYDQAFRSTANALRNWPTTSGQITSAAFTPSLIVSYEFTVAGQTYVGHGVRLGHFSNPDEAQAFITEHPPGTSVIVYYDPAHPSTAYLHRDGTVPAIYRQLGWVCAAMALPGCCAFLLVPAMILPSAVQLLARSR